MNFIILNNKLKPANCETLEKMIIYINGKYKLNLIQREENNYFKIGLKDSFENSPNPQVSSEKILSKIHSLRDKSEPKTNENQFKNKIV